MTRATSAAILLAAFLAGCSTPQAADSCAGTAGTLADQCASAAGRPADFLPRESELPPGYHAPQGSEHPDVSSILQTVLNGSNPYFGEGRAIAWYLAGNGYPQIWVNIDDHGQPGLKETLPALHVCEEDRGTHPDRFLSANDGIVAHYMFEGNTDPTADGTERTTSSSPASPAPAPAAASRPSTGASPDRAFDQMVDAIALRTGASEACAMQRTMYPTGWEEPNDARDQAVNARGYFDGLQVKDGDVDWFQLKAGTWSTVHVDVQGDGVQASVMYANGTLLAPGPGGWWLEVPNPTEEFTLFAKVEGSGTYAITLDESRPEAP